MAGNVPREVHITLVRDGSIPLGLRLTRDRHGIVTRGVDEGSAMQRWNLQHPGMEVGRGDRLVSVNGVAVDGTWGGWCTILAEFRKHNVSMVVLRNVNRPRRQGPLEPSVALDHLLPDGFLDGLPRNLRGACNCEDECAICLEELQEGSDVVDIAMPTRVPLRMRGQVVDAVPYLPVCAVPDLQDADPLRQGAKSPQAASDDGESLEVGPEGQSHESGCPEDGNGRPQASTIAEAPAQAPRAGAAVGRRRTEEL
eukprot:CAMPEP_0171245378 /NCGR_PEP_ID=MMETSP0790-20130122/47386_1 /TAXON_ID=2925 /ORGANISM="Alexandrium catenella, Strain OF101" /LENGTH=253 /DNA_ID=CAMNT_0011712629 /DNA_START=34 /DNA_END=795 /DNA_ORIENTATION=-